MSDSVCPMCGGGPLESMAPWGLPHLHCGTCGALTRPDVLEAEEAPVEGGDYPAPEEAKDAAYADGLYRLEALAAGRELLDVGSGYGRFLKKARARGWRVQGIEAGEASSARARGQGLEVRTGRLQDQKFDHPFSAATLWDVLEVLPDPVGALKKVHDLLSEGGVVLVRVRNADLHVFAQRRLGFITRRLKSAAPIFHRFAFGAAGLRAAFEKAGLETIDIVNSPATAGDPYGRGSAAVSLIKSALGAAAGAAYVSSRGKTLLGSSILGVARRRNSSSGRAGPRLRSFTRPTGTSSTATSGSAGRRPIGASRKPARAGPIFSWR